jgi:alkylation response protein AidB-like acyl-CoA dehydrogenase
VPVLAASATGPVLSDELLAGIECRADGSAEPDRALREDGKALREIGYFRAPVPVAYGGPGLTLHEIALLHRRIGYRSAATALASSMHLSWAGAAADRLQAGDAGLGEVLQAVADGYIACAGNGEPGDGHGLRGKFALRAVPGDDGALDGAIVPPDRVLAVIDDKQPAGAAYLNSVAAWAVVLTSNVYLGAAQRAFDLAVEATADRVAAKFAGGPHANGYSAGASLAESAADLDAIEVHLDAAALEWTDRQPADSAWSRRLLSVRRHTTRSARGIVSRSLEAAGDQSPRRRSVIERLYRGIAAGTLQSRLDDVIAWAPGSPELSDWKHVAR